MSGKLTLYNKHNFSIAKLAGTGSGPYSTQGILVLPGKTVATDGACLLEVTTPDQDRACFPRIAGQNIAIKDRPYIMPADAALKVAKAIPKNERIPILMTAAPLEPELGKDGKLESVGFVVTDLYSPQVIRAAPLEGVYPNTDKGYPVGKPVLQVSLDAKRLKEMAQWFAEFTGPARNHVVTLSVYSSGQPLLFEAEADSQKARGLLAQTR